MIHFDLLFECGVTLGSKLIFCIWLSNCHLPGLLLVVASLVVEHRF